MKFSRIRFPLTAKRIDSVKGTGFSPYITIAKMTRASAPEGKSSHLSRFNLFAAILLTAAVSASSQTTPAPPPPDQSPQPHGQVIFSRSTDENGQTTTTVGPAAAQFAGQPVTAPVATDAERHAVTFTALNLDVHLHPIDHKIAIRALLTVRNDGQSPLTHIPLQISSSLDWEHIRVDGRDVPFTVATLNSDEDHTGQLHEAAITLAHPLAPGATLQFVTFYSGAIEQSAKRLLAIGAPGEVALHSDWDEIGVDFTGLRGFGNVVWYPVSSIPAILGMSQATATLPWQAAGAANVDSARVFEEMGEHKLRISSARFSMRVSVEFPQGHAPTVALINGRPAPLHIIPPSTSGGDTSGFAIAELNESTLGFEAPSLFVANRTPHKADNTTLWTLPADEAAAPDWISAAATVTPFLQSWLGPAPRSQLTILDLPDPDDATFEAGPLLVTAMQQAAPDQLTDIFVHALAHAWMSSPRAWLSEGVAQFMGTLWLEKQSGRQKALEALESGRTALALEEPASPGDSEGQPLAQATSPVYYRTKAAYVFWMLRDLIGDPALAAAFRAYDPAADAARGLGPNPNSAYFEQLLKNAAAGSEASSESSSLAMSPAAPPTDLSWFFSDWIDNDKGLPDIAIDNVYPTSTVAPPPPTDRSVIRWRATDPSTGRDLPTPAASPDAPGEGAPVSGPEAGTWIVAVNLSNSGYAATQVPVTVSNAGTSITRRVVVPARGKITQRILIQGRPTQVQADDGTVPETEADIHITRLTVTATDSSAPTSVPQ